MQIAVLADIHGNLPALEAVLDDLKDFSPDQIIVAGDLIAGPYTNEKLHRLRKIDAWMILVKSDLNLLRLSEGRAPEAWLGSKQFGLLRWNSANISPENLDFIRRLPIQGLFRLGDTDPIRVVHGSPRDPFESILPDEVPFLLDLGKVSEPVLICGKSIER